jgi:hypothetical protein
MRPEAWQVIFQWMLFAGIMLSAVGGIGNFFSEKVTNEQKNKTKEVSEKQLTDKIDGLQAKLQPFENIANKMYPGIETDAALGRLSREIEDVKKETKQTYLIPSALNNVELSNGSFEYTFNLEADGKNVIPLLGISAESLDGVKINSISIQGSTLPLMSEGGSNNEQTARRVLYRSVPPSSFKVIIRTAKKTELKIGITPLKEK